MIETERLILRAPEPRDHDALHRLWSDPLVMADLGPVKSRADTLATIARHDGYRARGLGFWTTERRDDGVVVGFCGLKPGADDTPVAGAIEIGWTILSAHWGLGYAREAARASLAHAWAHSDAPRVVAITAARNDKSRALMTRIGMTRLPDSDFEHPLFAADDPLRSCVVYAIARPGGALG